MPNACMIHQWIEDSLVNYRYQLAQLCTRNGGFTPLQGTGIFHLFE